MSDLIKRSDAIDAIVAWTVEDRPNEVMPTDLVDRIKTLPSAERKGEWKQDGFKNWLCSECGSYALSVMTGCLVNRHMEQYLSNFCPNCGASMVRGEEEWADIIT